MTPHSFWIDLRAGAFEQGYLNAGGYRTRYLHAGSKGLPPLILLHGTGGHAECYTRNLIQHGTHFDTYAIDLVGHGYSDKPSFPYEIDIYVEHVRAVIDTLGFAKIRLSGESLGDPPTQSASRLRVASVRAAAARSSAWIGDRARSG